MLVLVGRYKLLCDPGRLILKPLKVHKQSVENHAMSSHNIMQSLLVEKLLL